MIQISAVPVSRHELLHLGQDLRLDRDVERGGRLVGDDQIGLVQQRDGDRHALAHAAGELVRIGRAGARRATGCRRCASASRARARAPRAATPRRAPAPSRSSACRSRSTGLSVIIGSWKIIAMRLPRSARSSLGASAEQVRALEAGCAPRDDAAGRIDQADDREAGHRSCPSRTRRPGPGSRPASTVKRDAVDRLAPRRRG